jgi:sialic acid synthase SpsE
MINVVANIGINWFSKKPDKRARQLVETAIDAGVSGVIVPMFKAEQLFREQQLIDGSRQYEILPELVYDLLQIADKNDVMFYLNPRYADAVDYGESIRVDGYHISNGDILYSEMIKRIGESKKPVLLSTGFSWIEEIKAAVNLILGQSDIYTQEVVLLHSTGGTPTVAEDAVLSRILNLMSDFYPMDVGLESFYSDDFLDYVAMGYPGLWGVVRRLDLPDNPGIEAEYSITPNELKRLVQVAKVMSTVAPAVPHSNQGFSQTDFEARRRLMRLPKDDFLLPPSCCPDSEQALEIV